MIALTLDTPMILDSVVSKACNELVAPISASLHPRKTHFEKLWQRWQVVGNTVSNLVRAGTERLNFRYKDERVTIQSTDLLIVLFSDFNDGKLEFWAPKSGRLGGV